jgi:hypothetical protein
MTAPTSTCAVRYDANYTNTQTGFTDANGDVIAKFCKGLCSALIPRASCNRSWWPV